MMALRLTVLALVLGIAAGQGSGNCVGNDGEYVDWWLMIKPPNGHNYTYLDAGNPSASLKVRGDINDKTNPSALVRTLKAAFTESGFKVMMYNDQRPDGTDASNIYAHSKGVIGLKGGDTGFWLAHSTPEFPEIGNFYFPDSEDIYGQTFICLSLDIDNIDKVAANFVINRPYLYSNDIPASASPNLGKVINKEWNKESASTHQVIKTVGGQSFTTFGKNQAWDADLFEDLIAPTLKGNFFVESWIRGQALGPYCGSGGYKWNVSDVHDIALPDGTSWKETQDHSKWGVSVTDSWACIADINRMTSQRKRGGGAICINGALSKNMRSLIVNADWCSGPPAPPPAPGACCYYSDDKCSSGQVCCKTGCDDPSTCSYGSSSSCNEYGAVHNCAWTNDECVVQ